MSVDEAVSIEISDEMASIGAAIVHEGNSLGNGDSWIAEEVYRQMLRQAAKENKVRLPDQSSLDEDGPRAPGR